VFAEVPRLEAEPLSVFEKRNQQSTNSRDKALEFVVKWILPKIIVQVPDQMDEAFLLRARKRIISSIKIGYDGALEFGKQWFQEFRFTVRPQPENYPSIVGKDPNILVRPRDIYLCFIEMHYRSIQEFAQQPILGSPIVFSELLNKTDCRLRRQLFGKKIKCGFRDKPIRHSQRNPLVNDPRLKAPPELLAPEDASSGRGVVPIAKVAVAHNPRISDNGLVASCLAEH
jgi:hypothetical protein